MNNAIIEEVWKQFGQQVRQRREALGLTQEGAGKKAGMKRQQWSRIEQGASTTRATVVRIAEAIQCDPAEALTWAGFQVNPLNPQKAGSYARRSQSEIEPIDSPEDVLLQYFRALDAEGQLFLITQAANQYQKQQATKTSPATHLSAEPSDEELAALGLKRGELLYDISLIGKG